MKTSTACVLVIVVIAIPGYAQPEKPSDLDRIQGLWKAVSAESKGMPIRTGIANDMHIAFAGNRMIAFGEADVADAIYVFKLNPKAKIKEIELNIKFNGKTFSVSGIYAFEADELKLCWDQDGGKRPTSFATPKEGRFFSVVLKREKLVQD